MTTLASPGPYFSSTKVPFPRTNPDEMKDEGLGPETLQARDEEAEDLDHAVMRAFGISWAEFQGEMLRAATASTPTQPCSGGAPPPSNQPAEKSHAQQEIEKRFKRLVKTWIRDTEYMSSSVQMAEHPAYREIISMGEAAVPLLLAELRRRPDFWFAALRTITGANPVPREMAGKVKAMAKAWLEWGQTKGYIP
jgi:hypothetical protein